MSYIPTVKEKLSQIDDLKKQENELINQRTNWGLIANSFLIISSAIAGAGGATDTILFQKLVPSVGFVISTSAFLGVYAAKKQLDYLKWHWKQLYNWSNITPEEREDVIRPFGNRRISATGSWPTLAIFLSLMYSWGHVLVVNTGISGYLLELLQR